MFSDLFRDAERLTPPPGLWDRIEANAGLRPSGQSPAGTAGHSDGPGRHERKARLLAFPQRPWMRAAASVALAAGVLAFGVSLRPLWHKPAQSAEMAGIPADNVRADAARAEPAEKMDLVDPDLLGWHADLGEVDMEADEAEEVL
ncbi:MAG: hypothetical protein ABI036_08395 [Fibrobacteria bacterium]